MLYMYTCRCISSHKHTCHCVSMAGHITVYMQHIKSLSVYPVDALTYLINHGIMCYFVGVEMCYLGVERELKWCYLGVEMVLLWCYLGVEMCYLVVFVMVYLCCILFCTNSVLLGGLH